MPIQNPMLPVVLLAGLSACAGASAPAVQPPGAPETAKTGALEAGATALQRDAPADALDVYLSGFHPMKAEPSQQVEAHHFCRQVNEDFMQCALFDGNTAAANLNGVEYIISERLYAILPAEERQYWHPHNGEILSGQLIAPGLPEVAETELMRGKINSYGKTWHTWDTRHAAGADASLPLGEPRLAWSFNREGEARPDLLRERDASLGTDTEARRQARRELAPLARPQVGVDALNGRFGGATRPIPGVSEAGSR